MPTPSSSAYALKLLSLPREVGLHPETGKPITAGLGRYGPFILHDGTYANLPTVEEVFDVGINRAVVLLAEKKAGGGKGRFQRAAPTVLKELGEHPSEGGKVQVLSGRYGPYVKHGDVNATLPRGKEPADLTMDEAVQLIAERAAKGPSKPKGRRAKAAKKADDAAARRRTARQSAKPKAKAQAQGQVGRHPRGGGVGSGRRRRCPANRKKPAAPRDCRASKTSSTIVRTAGTKAGKREIARAFSRQGRRPRRAERPARRDGRGGPARAATARASRSAGKLPPVAVLEIVARDADGELIGEPAVWDADEGERPRVLVLAPRGTGRPGEPRARPGRPHPGAPDAAR